MQNYTKSTLWRVGGGIVVIAILAVGIAWLVGSNNDQSSSSGGLKVVAAENFWGNIAGQIGGNHVHVDSIITDPTADPHLYESNAENASEVSSAGVVIVNGLGYDDFMSKLLGASNNDKRQVLTASKVLNVTGEDANPHLWYDIPRVHLVAAAIADSFEKEDPSHKSDYERNLKTFDDSLQPLISTIDQIKSRYSGDPVAYTERVPGYLLADAGLDVKTPKGFAQAIEDGTDPSPADTSSMDGLMTGRSVRVLLYNAQATSPVTQHVKSLAQKSDIPVIGVTETLPTNYHTYQSWQQGQLDEILKALETR